MKKITLFVALLVTAFTYGQNIVAISQVKGQTDTAEACTAGGKAVISYPLDWYTGTGETPDALYAGESSDASWKWDESVTVGYATAFFNGEAKVSSAYASGDTDVTAMISSSNNTDFVLKAYNARATNNTLACSGPGNKVLRYSLELTSTLALGETATTTITITNTNNVSENIVLTVTADAPASTNNLEKFDFNFAPNPANDFVRVSAQSNIEKVEVYNLLGKKVSSTRLNSNNSTLDVSELASGIYVMQVTIEDKVGSFKIVKK